MRHVIFAFSVFLAFKTVPAGEPEPHTLTLDDRVKAQRAIEEVYWRHRIWPTDNPMPKPTLDSVLPLSAIRAKVEDDLEKSDALEKLWGRALTSVELQAEMERMATQTRAGGTLKELFEALGNDPTLIGETLARHSLADRLVRNRYARDGRFHDGVRARAEAALAGHKHLTELKGGEGVFTQRTWRVTHDEPGGDATRTAGPQSLPVGFVSPLRERDDAFYVTEVLETDTTTVTAATISWPKEPFDVWWASRRAAFSTSIALPTAALTAVAPRNTTCTADTWSAMDSQVPDPREYHTAVWTGSEMIVWGGYQNGYASGTGGRYDPATDTWIATPTGFGAPSPRFNHGAVWTGTEMIIWGGKDAIGHNTNTGSRYDPLTDTWRSMSTGVAPEERIHPSIFWTGSKVLIWGGDGCTPGCHPNKTGGLYDPSNDIWSSMNSASAPVGRYQYSAVWTGSTMIVWGGHTGSPSSPVRTGGRYDPASDTWLPTSTGTNVPAARYGHTAVWTGTEMIVWGGSSTVTGGRYNPVTDTWLPTSTGANVPSARGFETSIWDGHRMIIWGGSTSSTDTNTGASYDPSLDTWTPTGTGAGTPSPRHYHTAVWTGEDMIVWGGYSSLGSSGGYTSTGARFNPETDTWVTTGMGSVPEARSDHVAVWTGAEMIVWGGSGYYGVLNSGGRYDPVTDSWSPTSLGPGVPVGRAQRDAVWTGAELIFWGGSTNVGSTNTGGRYDPVTDSWRETSLSSKTPTARWGHTAVWSGREMIVWGGDTNPSLARRADRYDPYTDSWTNSTAGSTAPDYRGGHSAVFVSGKMIVWGGYDNGSKNTGGRYDPSTDTWLPTSVGSGVPQGREEHSAVAANGKMIIWGGQYSYLNTGGVYDPVADTWTPTNTESTDVPAGRFDQAAVWSGTSMIVWGGYGGVWPNVSQLSSGGRYDPTSDSWMATSLGINVPTPRRWPKAVWTGTEMIVWGGGEPTTATGGRYCACPNGRLVYRDADGDGYGDPGVSAPSCDGSAIPGYAIDYTDCHDADPTVHPGAAELCNGVDDNCDGQIDENASGVDSDADGLHNACDNCPLDVNPTQSDFNHDGEGDACDLNDGLIYVYSTDPNYREWQAESGYASWNSYRGSLVVLRSTGQYTQAPGSNPLAAHDCGVSDPHVFDADVPAPGDVAFNLVTGVAGGVESSLGADSAGVPRANANPCP